MEPSTVQSEREWILVGMAECCAAEGYEHTTVADICAAAGISVESFDRAFAGKEECLGATMDAIVAEAWSALDTVLSRERPWGARLRDGVAALLRVLASRAGFGHVALVEAPAAGGRASLLHRSAKAALLAFLEQGREHTQDELPASAALGALAGAEALVVSRIHAGEGARLAELTPDIVYMLAVPFLGRDEALRLAADQRGQGQLRAVA